MIPQLSFRIRPHLPPTLGFGAASNPLPLSDRERWTRSASEGKGVGEADAKRLVRVNHSERVTLAQESQRCLHFRLSLSNFYF